MSRRRLRPDGNPGVEIRSYAPHGELAPRDYELSPHLTRLERDFHAIVRKFLQHTRADEFNASYLDGVIAATEQETLADLDRQRVDHVGAVTHLVEKLWRGDRIKAESRWQKLGGAWWSSPPVLIFLTVALAALDAVVLYSLLDTAMTQAAWMGIAVAFGAALVLNFLPSVVAACLQNAVYGLERGALAKAIAGALAALNRKVVLLDADSGEAETIREVVNHFAK